MYSYILIVVNMIVIDLVRSLFLHSQGIPISEFRKKLQWCRSQGWSRKGFGCTQWQSYRYRQRHTSLLFRINVLLSLPVSLLVFFPKNLPLQRSLVVIHYRQEQHNSTTSRWSHRCSYQENLESTSHAIVLIDESINRVVRKLCWCPSTHWPPRARTRCQTRPWHRDITKAGILLTLHLTNTMLLDMERYWVGTLGFRETTSSEQRYGHIDWKPPLTIAVAAEQFWTVDEPSSCRNMAVSWRS